LRCTSCANTLPEGVSYCPTCGVTTPYNISRSGVAPDSPTSRSISFETVQMEQTTRDEFMPYGAPVQNPYDLSDPYLTPPQAPPPPSPTRRRLSVAAIVSIIAVIILVSAIGFVVVSHNQSAGRLVATPQHTTAGATAPASLAVNPYGGGGTLALDDPLRDNSQGNNWSEISATATNGCVFKDSAYHALLEQGSYTTCNGGPSFKNLAMEAQVKVLKGDCGGIIFRSDSSGHHYLFEICPDGGYGVYVYYGPSGNDYQTIHTGISPAIKKGLNQMNLIAAVAVDQNIRLFVNKQQVYQTANTRYAAGQCGFAIDSSGAVIGAAAPTEVEFENLKVWTL